MTERVRFIKEWVRGDLTMTALCHKYGISRQTGYTWISRWQQLGYSDADKVDLLVRRATAPGR